LGMLWKRVTAMGGFLGLLSGTLSAITMFFLMRANPEKWTVIFALSSNAQGLAQAMYQALWSFLVCVLITVMVSFATKPKADAELTGLVMGLTELPKEGHLPLLQRPLFWGAAAMALLVVLQWIFW
jgi:SSS family solute:Na+ symporter